MIFSNWNAKREFNDGSLYKMGVGHRLARNGVEHFIVAYLLAVFGLDPVSRKFINTSLMDCSL